MELNDYQQKVLFAAIYPLDTNISKLTLELCGEIGEIAGEVKKITQGDGDFSDPKAKLSMAKELGDVLFYISALANALGLSLQEVAEVNLWKLKKRSKQLHTEDLLDLYKS